MSPSVSDIKAIGNLAYAHGVQQLITLKSSITCRDCPEPSASEASSSEQSSVSYQRNELGSLADSEVLDSAPIVIGKSGIFTTLSKAYAKSRRE